MIPPHQITTEAIERGLSQLTEWESGPAETLDSAMVAAGRGRTGGRATVFPTLGRPLSRGMVTVLLTVFVGLILTGALLPSLGKARSSARAPHELSVASDATYGWRAGRDFDKVTDAERKTDFDRDASGRVAPPDEFKGGVASVASDRQVIRKATLDLKARDVRAAFMKVALVLNEARSEYIETSSLTGDGDNTSGQIVLRVAADRLSEVLNQLRPLGTVTAETSTGQDVTDQIVDVEARIRNEQRIEIELLELVTKRQDAPLKEVLDLRESLSRVRENIERMTASRERLGHLVALATVLVSIRSDASPIPVVAEDKGIGAYFARQIKDAWRSALVALADTAAFFVKVLIGGIIWWIALTAAVFAFIAARRKARRAAALEPVPTH